MWNMINYDSIGNNQCPVISLLYISKGAPPSLLFSLYSTHRRSVISPCSYCCCIHPFIFRLFNCRQYERTDPYFMFERLKAKHRTNLLSAQRYTFWDFYITSLDPRRVLQHCCPIFMVSRRWLVGAPCVEELRFRPVTVPAIPNSLSCSQGESRIQTLSCRPRRRVWPWTVGTWEAVGPPSPNSAPNTSGCTALSRSLLVRERYVDGETSQSPAVQGSPVI